MHILKNVLPTDITVIRVKEKCFFVMKSNKSIRYIYIYISRVKFHAENVDRNFATVRRSAERTVAQNNSQPFSPSKQTYTYNNNNDEIPKHALRDVIIIYYVYIKYIRDFRIGRSVHIHINFSHIGPIMYPMWYADLRVLYAVVIIIVIIKRCDYTRFNVPTPIWVFYLHQIIQRRVFSRIFELIGQHCISGVYKRRENDQGDGICSPSIYLFHLCDQYFFSVQIHQIQYILIHQSENVFIIIMTF